MGNDIEGGEDVMGPRTGTGIVSGQTVAQEKVRRARELRRELTPEEATLWHSLRNNRLAGLAFRRQQVIDGFIVEDSAPERTWWSRSTALRIWHRPTTMPNEIVFSTLAVCAFCG